MKLRNIIKIELIFSIFNLLLYSTLIMFIDNISLNKESINELWNIYSYQFEPGPAGLDFIEEIICIPFLLIICIMLIGNIIYTIVVLVIKIVDNTRILKNTLLIKDIRQKTLLDILTLNPILITISIIKNRYTKRNLN